MGSRTANLLKVALNALHFTGVDRLLAPLTGGAGVIFMLHRVRPSQGDGFGPNRILEITPEFLDATIRLVQARGFDVVSLDEVHARLGEGDFERPFACFTFDDGYRDNREYAYPIFSRHRVPLAIYVPTDFPDGRGDLWWIKLEMAIAAAESVDVRIDGAPRRFATGTPEQKQAAFDRIYWWLRSIRETEARRVVDELCAVHGVDTRDLCRELIMGWDELRELAQDPLVTIGAHTRRHMALAKLTRSEARLEVVESLHRLERELGRPIRHFSFPYGDEASAGAREFEIAREAGFATAVTTRKGLVHQRHILHQTGLPRLSLNGNFQSPRYIKVMLTGVPFALWNMAARFKAPAMAVRFAGWNRLPRAAGTST